MSMDAELKEAFERIESKIDTNNANVNQRFDSVDRRLEDFEKRTSSDHDAIIGIEKDIEHMVKESENEKENQAVLGRGLSKRIDDQDAAFCDQDKRMNVMDKKLYVFGAILLSANQGIEGLKTVLGPLFSG